MIIRPDKFNRIFKCDLCGKREMWGPAWSVYGSLLINEADPDAEIHCCGEDCAIKVLSKIKSGELALPEYVVRGYAVELKRNGHGYGKFMRSEE